MAPPWGNDYIAGSGHLNKGAAGGEISCATKAGSPPQVWFRVDNGGDAWSEPPVLVGTISSGSKLCQCWYDGQFYNVYNGTTLRWRSPSGNADTWEAY